VSSPQEPQHGTGIAAQAGLYGQQPQPAANGHAPQQVDWAQIYADNAPDLTAVNGMTCPEALVWYWRNGFHVRPVEVDVEGKRKLALLRPGYHFDTLPYPAEAEINGLAQHWNPAWRLGMVLSRTTGLWAIDVDDMDQWPAFQAQHAAGLLPTATQQTGREAGGQHLVYRRPEDADEDALRPGKWSSEFPGIEVKSKGLIDVAPSAHHKTGKRYQWTDGREPAEPGPGLLRSRGDLVIEEHILRRQGDLMVEREARRRLDAREYEQACGARLNRSFAELAAAPKPDWVLPGVLTAGVYGMAGPPEAGKSLTVRDWLCGLGARGVPGVYAMSEGQHDVVDRFRASPDYKAAEPLLRTYEGPLALGVREDQDWFISAYRPHQPRLIVFDMIYGFGLPDDQGVRDVAPVLNGCKRIAAELGACVLVTGHPGHSGERRFRGSSMWRGAFDGEFHLAEGSFTCEKHKYADKRAIRWSYTIDYPLIRQAQPLELLSKSAQRMNRIAEDIRLNPAESDRERARRLASELELGADYARSLIRQVKKMSEES
jgi:hypothetical protein